MKPARILIVDDDKTYGKLLQSTLAAEGFIASAVEDGSAALRLLTDESVDLIISDIKMPKLDGYEFVHELKVNIRNRNTPVIMLTASSISEQEEFWSRELGAKAFITKTGHYKEIIKKVKEILMPAASADAYSARPWRGQKNY
jgi:DNA-binding response OmpR family regulator